MPRPLSGLSIDMWALVTGASAGIGAEFTEQLALQGYDIILVSRDTARLDARAKYLQEKFSVATEVISADLSTRVGMKSVEERLGAGGVEFLVRSAREHAGELEIVAIGPLTNIARAIEADSEFARNVKRIWMMGGDYSRDFAEHNVKCDVAAAKIVFGSGVAISVMPLDVTRQVAISISDLICWNTHY